MYKVGQLLYKSRQLSFECWHGKRHLALQWTMGSCWEDGLFEAAVHLPTLELPWSARNTSARDIWTSGWGATAWFRSARGHFGTELWAKPQDPLRMDRKAGTLLEAHGLSSSPS